MRPRLSLVGQERAGSVRWFLEPGELTSRDRGRFRGIVFFFFLFQFCSERSHCYQAIQVVYIINE